jgi:hypothetical protein
VLPWIALLVVMATAEILASGRLGSSRRLDRSAADVIWWTCGVLFPPIVVVLDWVAPHPWGPLDYRSQTSFHVFLAAVAGLVEVGMLVEAVRALRRWRRR